ncbi:MAG: 30S ribosomal protein S8 [Candidatus Berkelbacteria bacterium]|nr:30S ribosomal protein S8 [Candidatus Berkelbacteria bacterium]
MDTISNMFVQLKNAGKMAKKETKISYSKMNLAILEILKNKGYITKYQEIKATEKKYPIGIEVTLKYKNKDELVFENIKKVSTPGKRVYLKASRLGYALKGKSDIIISTSQGIMSGSDAKRKGLGGELIGEVM